VGSVQQEQGENFDNALIMRGTPLPRDTLEKDCFCHASLWTGTQKGCTPDFREHYLVTASCNLGGREDSGSRHGCVLFSQFFPPPCRLSQHAPCAFCTRHMPYTHFAAFCFCLWPPSLPPFRQDPGTVSCFLDHGPFLPSRPFCFILSPRAVGQASSTLSLLPCGPSPIFYRTGTLLLSCV